MSIQLSTAIEVEQPPSVVWDVVADYDHDPAWRKGVETMDPSPHGPVAPGTTTREVLRMAGRTYRNDGEVIDVEPGRCFSWRTTSGAVARGSRTVEPIGSHICRVRLELEVQPQGAERLMAPMLRRMLARNLEADGRRLAELLEDRAAGSVTETQLAAR